MSISEQKSLDSSSLRYLNAREWMERFPWQTTPNLSRFLSMVARHSLYKNSTWFSVRKHQEQASTKREPFLSAQPTIKLESRIRMVTTVIGRPRETREGWALPTVETTANGWGQCPKNVLFSWLYNRLTQSDEKTMKGRSSAA